MRYRYDEVARKRYKTVELIVEETPYVATLRWKPDTVVGVRIELRETGLQAKVKQAGGKWNRDRQLWEVRYDQVLRLGLENRIASQQRSTNRSPVKP